MIPTSSPTTSDVQLTAEQLAKASNYLVETRAALVESVAGLSTLQWTFKPAPDRWSIEEIIEHMVLIENVIHGIIGKMSDAPEAPPDWQPAPMDDFIPTEIPKGLTKIKAPESVWPTHRWRGVETLQRFLESREQTMQLVSAPSLRGRVVLHPVLGPWDGYHWLLAAGAHCSRHTGQIREVKADPDFVETSGAAAKLQ
ncbi:MAG TPA: DinB family protein [Bryobacteraceae bacterium]|nr:DinB family protein [Bryobacteraceae bacterium]